MEVRKMMEEVAHGLERRSVIAALAVAGIVGPILFTVAFVVQGLFRLGEYSPVAEVVSALEAGPWGWVQQVNFVVFGLLTVAFAVGLHLGLRPSRWGVIGPSLLVLSGMALVWAAVFPLREDAAGLIYDLGLHIVGGVTYFLSSAFGLIVVSRRLAADPRWRHLAGYALITGITALALFVAMRASWSYRRTRRCTLGPAWRSGLCSRCCSPAWSCSRSGCCVSRGRPVRRADRARHCLTRH
jgi:hypothetical protein